MKPTEFWLWRVKSETSGKVVKTRHRMTATDALARHPEAVRVEGSVEIRDLPETDEERLSLSPSAFMNPKPKA